MTWKELKELVDSRVDDDSVEVDYIDVTHPDQARSDKEVQVVVVDGELTVYN